MRKTGKRILVFMLALIIFATSIPVPSQAATKTKKVKSVTMNYSQYVLQKGKKLKLKATVAPKGTKVAVKWKSSNPKVATVSSKGVVKAKGKKGKAVITVTAGKKKAKCKIIIGTAVKTISASNLQLKEGETKNVGASVLPANATIKTLSYESSNDAIAQVDKNGNVKALKEGTAQITIKATDCNKVKKTVSVSVAKKQTVQEPDPVPVPEGSFTITLFDGNSKLKEVVKEAGTLLKGIQAPYIEDKLFLGWYYDADFTKEVKETDTLKEELALYGKYGDSRPISEEGSPNYLCATEQTPDFTIVVDAHSSEATVQEVESALQLTNLTDTVRTDGSNVLEKDELLVEALAGSKFSVKAKNGYQAGSTYKLEILQNDKVPELTFEDQPKEVIYYNFTINKEELMNLSLDTQVIYLPASKLSDEDSEKIMAYTGLYEAIVDPETGETTYSPTNAFGTFTYDEGEFLAGDIIAVYTGVKPDERDLNSSLDEGVAYIEITKAEGSSYSYKSAKTTDVLFTPDIIPIDIDEGDGVTGWTESGVDFSIESDLLDFTEGYEDSGLDFNTVVEEGDFVAFYSGQYGKEDAETIGYGKILSVEEMESVTKISYAMVSYEEVIACMDIYNESELSKEQLDSIDEELITETVKQQVLESGFAEEAGVYLASMAVETDEVKEMLGESDLELKDCLVTYSDGTPVPDLEKQRISDAIQPEGIGAPEISVSISKKLQHFKNGRGFRVELALKYGFDVQAAGFGNKISIEMTAVFETEVLLNFSASGGAVWKTAWIFPYIYDYRMSGSIDQGLYTGIAVTATAKTAYDNQPYGPDIMDTDGLEDYGQKIVDLSESIKNMMEEYKQKEAGSEESEMSGLVDKYEEFIRGASNTWIDLVSVPIFEASGSLDPFYITAYGINVDFVVSASMSVAIGMSFQYEKSQRHTFTLMLFHGYESSSDTVDLSAERYQFDFYVMGTLGIRAGIRAKVLFGVFSVKLAGIGIQVEAGAYARLWGYFYYCLSWEKGKGKESSATGAMLIEIGAYINIQLALEVLNGKFSYMPTLYEKEWPIWNVGERENVLDFAYDDNGYWKEGIYKRYSVPLSYDMVRKKEIEIPSEVFRMRYMDLKKGGEGYLTYDSKTRGSMNSSSSKYDDEDRFFVEMSNPVFSYNPITNTISVNPEEGRYSYEGTMTITWRQPDVTFASKTLSKTFEVSWIDPDAGYMLTFNTKGGTYIRSKVYDEGKEVESVADPTKVGYEFGGWYSDKECTQPASVPTTMPARDVELFAKWIPIPNVYTVNHHYELLDKTYAVWETTVQDNVYTDDYLSQEKIVEDNKIELTGFDVNYRKAYTTPEATVKPDGSTVVDIYYDREIYSVTYSMGELADEDNKDVTIKYRYEENIYAPEYFMYGYTFKGWDKEIQKQMGLENLSYTAKWEGNPDTPYYLEYYMRVPGTEQYVMLGGENGKIYKEGTTGDTVKVSDYLIEDTGYHFVKATVNGVTTDKKGTGVIDPKGRLTIRYYYEGATYGISFDPKGGTILSAAPTEYIHGVAVDLENVTAQRTGYRFLGWFEGKDADEPLKSISIFRAGEIALEARWETSTSEINLFDTDGSTSLGTVTATYGDTIPSLKEIPKKDGYEFAGFYTEHGVSYYDEAGNGRIVWESTDDISLKAKWIPKNVEISFDTNGADTDVLPIEGTYLGKYPPLPSVEREGYHLLGWVKENTQSGAYVTTDTEISDWKPHTLVAQWAPDTDTPYTVECYVESTVSANEIKSDGVGYILYASYVNEGTTEKTVSADGNTYNLPGYTFDASVEGTVLSDTIKADGSTVLKLYYKEGKRYTVTYQYGNGIPSTTELVTEKTYVKLPFDTEVGNHNVLKGWTCNGVFYGRGSGYYVEYEDVKFEAVIEKGSYTISYRNNSPLGGEEFKYETMTYDETYKVQDCLFKINTVNDEETGKTQSYEFVGWNTLEDGTGKWYYPGDEISNLEVDDYYNNAGFLYAQWELKDVPEDMVPYYVVYNIQDESGMYRGDDVLRLYGKLGDTTQAVAYEFADIKAEAFEQKTIQTGEAADNCGYYEYEGYTVVEISYTRDKYALEWDFNGGTVNEDAYYSEGEIPKGGSIYAPPNPTKEGCEFVGWNAEVPSYMPGQNVKLVAQYKVTNIYGVTVKYYMEDLEGDGYSLASTDVAYGEGASLISPEPVAFTGFVTPETKQVEVLEDGSGVCEYYYEREEYTLSWDPGEGILTGTDYTQGTVKYGTEIKAPGLTRTGYTGEWKGLSKTMPAQDMVYTPNWTPKTVSYSVFFRKMNADGTYTSLYSSLKWAPAGSTVVESSEISADYAKEVEEGYVKPITQVVTIEGNGSTIIYYDYKLKKSHLYYDFSGGRATTSNFAQSGDYYYGRILQVPPLGQVEKQGYTAVGWYNAADPDQTIITDTVITIGSEDVTYKLKWEPVEYSITYDLGIEDAENVYNPVRYQKGFDFNIAGAISEHNGFARWQWNGDGEIPEGVEILENGLVHVTGKAKGDLSFRAEWDPYCKQFIGKMFEDSTDFYIYNYPETTDPKIAEVAQPTREGYIFEYWTKKVPDSKSGYYTVRIPDATNVSALNLNTDFITAKWMPITKRADGSYMIHVSDETELVDAVNILHQNPDYKGIILDKDIKIRTLSAPYFDVLEKDYEIDGNYHRIIYEDISAPFIQENYGTIKRLKLQGNANYYAETSGEEETYFGIFVNKNYGSITECVFNADDPLVYSVVKLIKSDATYVGGIAGYNTGVIYDCKTRCSNVTWDNETGFTNGKKVAYVGGITGYNDYNGEIRKCVLFNSRIKVESAIMKYEDQEVYAGGCAGMSQGLITGCEVNASTIGISQYYDMQNDSGYMCSGGIVGIDAMEQSETPVRAVNACKINNSTVGSGMIAGGVIGECNYGKLTRNELDSVTVYSNRGYAGHIAGVYRSVEENEDYSYISNAKTLTDSGKAGVITGLGVKPEDCQIRHATLGVRSKDDKTKVVAGSETQAYSKGAFHYIFTDKKTYTKHTDMKICVEKW